MEFFGIWGIGDLEKDKDWWKMRGAYFESESMGLWKWDMFTVNTMTIDETFEKVEQGWFMKIS